MESGGIRTPTGEIEVDRQAWRLLPSERVLWHDRRVAWVSRDRIWTMIPGLLAALTLIFAAFAGLLWATELPGGQKMLAFAAMIALFAVAVAIAPRYLYDPCEYLVTDRRAIWRRGRMKRSMELRSISYGRIRWHRSAAGVGHLELVRAAPFGPLMRKQRLVLMDVRAPDVVFALIRGVEPRETAGASDVRLVERLDPGEQVVWGGHPEGWLLGWRELAIAGLGCAVVIIGLRYGWQASNVLGGLGDQGLAVWSWTWGFLFLAMGVTWGVITSVGVGLVWHGVWRARALGRQTEYILTDRRLLIRRGRTELSVDRKRIVDVAPIATTRGLHHVFLMLDGPGSRALAVNGALRRFPPPRDGVPPVLYEVRDVERVKQLILDRPSRPSQPPLPSAA